MNHHARHGLGQLDPYLGAQDNCLGHPKLSPHLGRTHYGIPVAARILLARHCLMIEGTTDR